MPSWDDLKGAPKQYVALLNQSGVTAPVATIIKSTLGRPAWSYIGVGIYRATLPNAFVIGKTFVSQGMFPIVSIGENPTTQFGAFDVSNTDLYVYDFGVPGDDLLQNFQFMIEVFP